MTGHNNERNTRTFALLRRASVLAVMGATFFGGASEVSAQTSSYQAATDNVTINWGAIDGAPAQRVPMTNATAPMARSGLRIPGPTVPRSTLHVPAPTGGALTLRDPAATPKAAPKPAPKPAAVAKAPAPKPAPAPAAPTPAPAPKVAEAPAKMAPPPAPAAPAPAATAAASAPPPPPPVTAAPAASAPPPPPPMPAAETAAAPAKAPEPAKEQASTPPAAETANASPSQVVFNGDDTKLSADGQAVLTAIIETLGADNAQRVQLLAYASGEDLTSSKARRISLSRALSVRSFLIEKGIRSTRIDVRALGDKAEDDPKNRVDVNLVTR